MQYAGATGIKRTWTGSNRRPYRDDQVSNPSVDAELQKPEGPTKEVYSTRGNKGVLRRVYGVVFFTARTETKGAP